MNRLISRTDIMLLKRVFLLTLQSVCGKLALICTSDPVRGSICFTGIVDEYMYMFIWCQT